MTEPLQETEEAMDAAWKSALEAARERGFGGDLIPRYFFFEAGYLARYPHQDVEALRERDAIQVREAHEARRSAEAEVERLREALRTLGNPNPLEYEKPYVRRMAEYAKAALVSSPAERTDDFGPLRVERQEPNGTYALPVERQVSEWRPVEGGD